MLMFLSGAMLAPVVFEIDRRIRVNEIGWFAFTYTAISMFAMLVLTALKMCREE